MEGDDAASRRPSSNGTDTYECEDPRCDKTAATILYCVDCDSIYCDACWPLQGPHRRNKVGRDGLPHERADIDVYQRIHTILKPPAHDLASIDQAHESDAVSKWFGVSKDGAGKLKFDDYGRYAALLSSFPAMSENLQRHPQLVSFVGVTNAGKSTIIKMLMSRSLATRSASAQPLPSNWAMPLVGSALHDSVPTSGDVNLYADPGTYASSLPTLFADCEGFEGGEKLPLGAIARWRGEQNGDGFGNTAASYPVEWANTDESRQREFVVANLYPRILYTFSDVVVFVLKNPKTFQSSVLTKLLDWGVNSLEKSINQPSLPHAVIVLNATDPNIPEAEWDPDTATASLLASVKNTIDSPHCVPKLQKWADHWRSLGKDIRTVQDLLLQYYSSFQVVRIPSSRFMLIDDQVAKLQSVIRTSCARSFQAKRRARMLTSGDELNVFFQAGFRHFSTHLDIPFDFVEVALRNNPIPADFGDHILHLATVMTSRFSKDFRKLKWFLEHLAVTLASCIGFDSVRFRKGRMVDLYRNYEESIDRALGEFFAMHWPCSFAHQGRRCALVKARHIKGHQDIVGVIASGDYESEIPQATAMAHFKDRLGSAMKSIQKDFEYEMDRCNGSKYAKMDDLHVVRSLHKVHLRRFFASLGLAANIFSHSSCFVCLLKVPQHPLPCGHVLCSDCIKTYGEARGKAMTVMSLCPLHDESPPWTAWRPITVLFKPKQAGVRVLSLDGGGIRAIAQLEILREIEEALGNFIPIACFFDLIVGSGSGAIVASALGIQKRRLNPETIDMFISMCETAFSPRLNLPPVMKLVNLVFSSSMYKTKQFRQFLKVVFDSDRKIFAGNGGGACNDTVRVGMLAATGAERHGVLLSNYHRAEPVGSLVYQLDRPSEPLLEMDPWEAAAAATATPGYFKPFVHPATHRTYLDATGTIPNPIAIAERERKLIWPETEDYDPDILLSLGTGQNRYKISPRLREMRQNRSKVNTGPPKSGFRTHFSSAKQEDIIQAELTWLEFEDSLPKSLDATARHHVRFNPDLGDDPPAPDDRGALRSMRALVKSRLNMPHRKTALRHIAHRLVATSFYFDLQSKLLRENNAYVCKGQIFCRFEDGSDYIVMLGRLLKSKMNKKIAPYFLIHAVAGEGQGFQV